MATFNLLLGPVQLLPVTVKLQLPPGTAGAHQRELNIMRQRTIFLRKIGGLELGIVSSRGYLMEFEFVDLPGDERKET